MKKFILLASAAFLLAQCTSEPRYRIEGEWPSNGYTLYLSDGKAIIDSTETAEGRFVFEGVVTEPMRVYMLGSDKKRQAAELILEEGNITMTKDPDMLMTASGTPANDRYVAYKRKQIALDKEMKEMEAMTKEQYDAYIEQFKEMTNRTYEENTGNVLGLLILAESILPAMEEEQMEAELAKFGPEWEQHRYVKAIREQLETRRRTAVGATYMDFSLASPDGNQIAFSSVVGEGKYVLLDFWASWCTPCMEEVPHLLAAYKKYHDKGFEIFGVSLDTDKDKWTRTIAAKGMDWIHVSALTKWECPVRKMYGVNSIPSFFLIGPDGKIVARDIEGEELDGILTGLIGE